MTLTDRTITERAGTTPGDRGRRVAGLEIVGVVAAGVGLVAARGVDLASVGDLGLAVALPGAYWCGLLVVNLAFAVAITRAEPRSRTMIVLLACLATMLFGVASAISPYPRAEPTWRHLGIIDHLAGGGPLDANVDAYFNWPGFFVAAATVSRMAGTESFDALVRWAPVWINGLWLLAMSLPIRLLAGSARRMWAALWVFCLANWIDQDYFSPQAFGLFLHLLVVGLLLWGVGAIRRPIGRDHRSTVGRPRLVARRTRVLRPVTTATARQRAGAVLAIVILAAAVTVSHQLTPLMTIISVATLTVFGRVWSRRLAFLLTVGAIGWLVTGASSYLNGHPVLALGGVDESASANVASRLEGSSGRLIVVYLRMALFGLLLALAALGWWRGRRATDARPARGPIVLLALAPFLLVPFNSYGGEMLLRATLFALPFLALLVAGMLPDGVAVRRTTRVATILLVTIGAVMWAGASVLARYGNARFDMFQLAEVAAVDELYARAPDGAVLVSAAHPTPWRDRRYAEFRHTTLQDLCRAVASPTECAHLVVDRVVAGGHGGMFLVLRSGRESLRMQGVLTPTDLARVEATIVTTTGARLVYENPSARLYAIGATS